MPASPMGSKHLSKSASELSSPREMPEIRPRSAAPPGTSHLSVYQKTHSFFTQLKSRWARSKSRERRHKSPGRQDSTGTDYAADLSSDHSSPSTQSPRHRLHTYTDSPLSRVCGGETSHSSASGSPKPRAPTPGAVAGLDLLPLTSTDDATRRRETALRQHSFFQLRVHLRRGQGLVAMDKNGTSDPYVKFKCGGRLIYKSRTVYRELNPVWDESFTVAIEDPFVPIQMKVFDYDWGLQDDFMGSASLDLTTLDLGKTTDITLCLQDPSRSSAQLGEIMLTATLYPKSQEDKEQVALIIGVSGACRSDELLKMKDGDINILESRIVIVIPVTKTYCSRSFVITKPEWIDIIKQYHDLRKNVKNDRFFLQMRFGKITEQPFGHNAIGSFPKKIAIYLKLENVNTFTGHCLRRTSATLLANTGGDILQLKKLGGWKSSTVAEGYVENSLNGQLKIANMISQTTHVQNQETSAMTPLPTTETSQYNFKQQHGLTLTINSKENWNVTVNIYNSYPKSE